MNAEQLSSIAITVTDDLNKLEILKNMNSLTAVLHKISQNPADTNSQIQVRDFSDKIRLSLEKLKNIQWSTTIKEVLFDLGGGFLIDDTIENALDEALTGATLTAAASKQIIDDLKNKFADFTNRLSAAGNSLQNLGIIESEIEIDAPEIGYLIPRNHIDNTIHNLAIEIIEYDKILRLCSTVSEGTIVEHKVSFLSTSEPKIFTNANIKTAGLIGFLYIELLMALNGTADLYKNYQNLVDAGLPEQATQEVKSGIEKKLEEKFELLAKEAVEKFSNKTEKHDKAEDENRIKIVIDRLAPRIENGFSIDIRVAVLPDIEENDDQSETDEVIPDVYQEHRNLSSISTIMDRMIPHDTPILSIPAPIKDEEIPIPDKNPKKK